MAGREGISSFSILLLMAVAAVTGIAALSSLKVQYTPSEPANSITVSFSYRGAVAQIVEAEATSKLEGVLSNVTGTKAVSSISNDGSGSVTLDFYKRTDMAAARFEVASLVRNIYPELPKGMSYPELSLNVSGFRSRVSLSYNIRSNLPTKEISNFVQERLVTPLSMVDGVDWVSLSGVTPYEWVVEFDPDLARIYGISADDISSAFLSHFSDDIIGLSESGGNVFSVKLSFSASDDFGAVPIKAIGGRTVFLRDIATFHYEESEPYYYFRLNGLNTVGLSMGISSGANLLSVTKKVKALVDEIGETFPDGTSVSLGYDSSEYVSSELNKIYFRTLLCLFLLLVFVFVVNRSWRYMTVIALTIAVNLLVAVAVYRLVGLRIHIYSLAGITVSLGIVIDSAIIMTDHYSRHHSRGTFPALFCATLTTVAVLVAIFFLPDKDRAGLADFAYVIAINLCVSLLTAYFFVPALLDYICLDARRSVNLLRRLRRVAKWNGLYERYISKGMRFRWLYLLVLVVSFGFLFVWFYDAVSYSNFYREPERRMLYIRAGMPEGCTIAQLNEVMRNMENHLAQFDEIEHFITQIYSHENGVICVYFKPEYENTDFPIMLKTNVTRMAVNFGGANWRISGVTQSYFNNNVVSDFKSDRITLSGYNYNELLEYAGILMDYLSKSTRVSDPEIWGAGYYDRPVTEYHINYDFAALAAMDVNPYSYYSALNTPLFDSVISQIVYDGGYVSVRLRSSKKDEFDLWHVLNSSVAVDSTAVKLSQIGGVSTQSSGISISKENQSYTLNVVFDFIGGYELEREFISAAVDYMNEEVLPLGYKAKGMDYSFEKETKYRYAWLICLVILLIYIICSIFFESVKLPLSVILLVPISFIGLFLTFWLSKTSFDRGGFAAFVMLVGVSVNSGIYLVHEFLAQKRDLTAVRRYVRAFNHKIVPIMLTVISTVLGLIPFLFDGPDEVFWFDFAVGTISGLIFSVFAFVLYLPVFCIPKKSD